MLILLLSIAFKLHKNSNAYANQIKHSAIQVNKLTSNSKLLTIDEKSQYTCQQNLRFDHEWDWRLLSAQNSYIDCEGSKISIIGTAMQGVRNEQVDAYPNGIIHIKNADFECTINKIFHCSAMNRVVQLIFFEGTGTHTITGTAFEFCGRSVNNYKVNNKEEGDWWPDGWNPSLIYIKDTSTNTISGSKFDHPETGTLQPWEICPVRCIRTSDRCSLTVQNTDFHNATSFDQGGAFFMLESEVSAVISYCTFRTCNDRSNNKFHAIYSNPSKPTENKILHCTFTDCGKGLGVTVCAYRPKLTFEDNTITFTDYTKSCRCIECERRGQYTFQRNTFSNAQTSDGLYKGTGIHMYNSIDSSVSATEEIKIIENTFDYIRGDNQGRCLQIQIRSNNVNNNFSSNTIKNCPDGGFCLKISFYTVVQSFKLDSWTFMYNRCTDSHGGGSGIWVQNFAENSETVFHKLELNIEKCKFMNNWSSSKGGALQVGFNNNADKDKYVVRNQVSIKDCTFQGNQATDAGGAISIQTLYPLTIENCMFTTNKAPKGGALYIDSNFAFNDAPSRMESATISDCTFNPNRGNDAHIMYFERSPILHVTIVGCNIDINFDSSYETSKVLIFSETKVLDVVSCTFYSGSMQQSKPCDLLFNCIYTESAFILDNCTFNIPNANSHKILDINVNDTKINDCKFINFGQQALTISTNYFDFSYNDVTGNNYFLNAKNILLPKFFGNTFHDFDLTSQDFNFITQISYKIEEFVLENNTFSNMRGGTKFGGGIGFVFYKDSLKYSHIIFDNCKFNKIFTFVGGSNGGAISIGDSPMFKEVAVTIQSCEFKLTRCQTSKGGAIYISIDYDFTVSDCVFDDSNSKGDGGAIYITSNSVSTKNIKIKNCQFKNCWGATASLYAIVIEAGKSEIENITVLFDDSDGFSNSCGAINLGTTSFQMADSQFIGTESRGAITFNQNINEAICVRNCTFSECKGENTRCFNIKCNSQSPIEFKDNTVCNMAASGQSGYFGAIESPISTLLIDNMTFINNECNSMYGGGSGLWLKGMTTITFQSCKFINNSALETKDSRPTPADSSKYYYNGDGGGIQYGYSNSIAKVNIEFISCLFKSNKAIRHGGAIALQTLGEVTIRGCIFEENVANYNQQQNSNKNVLLYENHFDKKTEGRGGAIYLNPCFTYPDISNEDYMTNVIIEKCKFISNSAFDGYAIYIEGDDPGTQFSITNNDFINNFNAETYNENSSIISTEICRKNLPYLDIKQNNNFSNEVSVREIVCVDHYGKALLTSQFSNSEFFSKSTAFSESIKFSSSDRFTVTGSFSESESFTSSHYFSGSKGFESSSYFSESGSFSGTDGFSQSMKFSKSSPFTDTAKFSPSFLFSETSKFSQSLEFTPISPDSSEPIESSSSIEPTESIEQTESIESSNSIEPTESIESSNSIEQTESIISPDSSESAESSISIEPTTESVEPTELIKSSDSSEPVESSDDSIESETETKEISTAPDLPIQTKAPIPPIVSPATAAVSLSQQPIYSNANENKSGNKKSVTLIIGIVVAVVALILILLVIIIIIIKRKRNKEQNTSGMENQSEEVSNGGDQLSDANTIAFANPLYNENIIMNDPFDQALEEDV